MGPVERFESDREADRFFAAFIDATPERIAAVENERDGDIAAVVAEHNAYGYWARKMAERAARRTAQEHAETVARAERFAALHRNPDETARLAPLPEASTVTLPEPRFVILTDPEYNETREWWLRLITNPGSARMLSRRLRNEASDALKAKRRADRAAAAWRLEQRAFERAQWRAAIAPRISRPTRKIANRWVAIDEDRALQIAIAALGLQDPPQGRK